MSSPRKERTPEVHSDEFYFTNDFNVNTLRLIEVDDSLLPLLLSNELIQLFAHKKIQKNLKNIIFIYLGLKSVVHQKIPHV